MTTTTLYIADSYAPGCPAHTRPRQVGYGLSRKRAIQNCDPWDCQAAWFRPRARAVVLEDGNPRGLEDLRAALYGIEDSHQPAYAAIRLALDGLRYSEAVRLAVAHGILVEPYQRRSRARSARRRVEKSFSIDGRTAAWITAEAKRLGCSQSSVIDRLVEIVAGPLGLDAADGEGPAANGEPPTAAFRNRAS
jgi:hypothetical protein